MTIDARQGGLLLSLARRSIAEGLGRGAAPAPPRADEWPAPLLEPAASFVTLKRLGLLRGCRGLLEPVRPLAHDVWLNAWSSAFDDPRFPPVAPDELSDLDIGISVLSALEPLQSRTEQELLGQVEPGRHGLVLALGPRRATFLPQVWESLPQPAQFLSELRAKAGLPRDFWSPQMEAWRYTTESVGHGD
jgi:AmmeMemoRadiSam system protein A